jgi:RNA polymerase sigma-70 factor (ECF subfamily)
VELLGWWTDGRLVRRLRQGDRDAAVELVRLHHAAEYGYLRRLGAPSPVAEELTQEAHMRAWQQIATLRSVTAFRPWLLAIARNAWLAHCRSPRRRQETGPEPDDLPSPQEAADDALSGTQDDRELHRVVEALQPELGEIVSLHYFQELTLPQVASVVGIPVGTVKSRLHRALAEIRARLGGVA